MLVIYRFGRWRCGVRTSLTQNVFSLIYGVPFKFIQMVTGIELPCEVQLGRNFVNDHLGGIIISGYSFTARDSSPRNLGREHSYARSHKGSQFTSVDFTDVLNQHGIRISTDGRGAWRDNVFVERPWRTIKYEDIYLHAYDSVFEAHRGIARYLKFYNSVRPHKSLRGVPPDLRYFASQALPVAA